MFKNMGGNIPGGNFLGENFPAGNFPRGSLMGGNFPSGSFPDTIRFICIAKTNTNFRIFNDCGKHCNKL